MRPAFGLGEIEVEPLSNTIRGSRGAVRIPPKAMDLLVCLARRFGTVVTRDELLDEVWNGVFVGDEVLSNAVWQIRQAVGDEARSPRVIETVPRRGYRLLLRPRFERPDDSRPSLAVLPFEDRGLGPGREYVSHGLIEGLVGALARGDRVRLVATSSWVPSKRQLDRIGWDLGVEHLVTGSVSVRGDELLVAVQVAIASSSTVVWADRVQRPMAELPELCDQLASALEAQLCDRVVDRLARRESRVDPAAHDLYLQGCFRLQSTEFASIGSGIELLEKAVETAPYAPAYAALARGRYTLASWGAVPGRDLLPMVQSAAERALELDSGLVEARVWWIMARWIGSGAPARALEELAELISKHQHHAGARDAYARCLAALGDVARAIEQERYALGSDPLSPVFGTALGFLYRIAGETDLAISSLERVRERHPNWRIADLELGRALLHEGEAARAAAAISRAEPEWAELLVARAEGDRAAALELLDRWEKTAKTEYVAPYWMAERCMWVGERGRALAWLERAVEQRQLQAMFAGIEPAFGPLRSEPRFQQLLRRLGVASASGPAGSMGAGEDREKNERTPATEGV